MIVFSSVLRSRNRTARRQLTKHARHMSSRSFDTGIHSCCSLLLKSLPKLDCLIRLSSSAVHFHINFNVLLAPSITVFTIVVVTICFDAHSSLHYCKWLLPATFLAPHCYLHALCRSFRPRTLHHCGQYSLVVKMYNFYFSCRASAVLASRCFPRRNVICRILSVLFFFQVKEALSVDPSWLLMFNKGRFFAVKNLSPPFSSHFRVSV